MECGFDTHKNALIKNFVILFVFFCDVEPIYSFFKPIGFFWFNKYIAFTKYSSELQATEVKAITWEDRRIVSRTIKQRA